MSAFRYLEEKVLRPRECGCVVENHLGNGPTVLLQANQPALNFFLACQEIESILRYPLSRPINISYESPPSTPVL